MASVVAEAPPPAVALDEVKAFLRVSHSAEDALIAGFVRAAEAACEGFTGLALIERSAAETLPAGREWRRLGLTPVRAILGAAAVAGDGSETALPAEAFAIDIDAAGDGWVRVLDAGGEKRVRVRFTAGLAGDWNGVPEPLRQGIVRLAAHLYGARGEAAGAAPPAAVAALWRPWRRLRLV
jgi:uncharacterized phiE125 gp8 family phage protein